MDELQLTLDHVTLNVANLERAKAFYAAALAPLGLDVVMELSAEITGDANCFALGIGRKGTFWVADRGQQTPPSHVCFRASSRKAVRAFHEAALAAGGSDYGAPGIRDVYHPAYYAAFVHDPEGHNIEAVCFEEE